MSEFDKATFEQWQGQVMKELKGQPFDVLRWEVEEGVVMEPYYTTTPSMSVPQKINNEWRICQQIVVEDEKEANDWSLVSLKGGANALSFDVAPDVDLNMLLAGIQTEYIDLHWTCCGAIDEVVAFLDKLPQNVRCQTFSGDSFRGLPPLPNVKTIGLDATDLGKEAPSEQLLYLMEELDAALGYLAERGVPPQEMASSLHIRLDVGNQFFVEIAKIRALKILVANVFKIWGISNGVPYIHVSTTNYHEDQNQNLIAAGTQALSIAIAGVDCITVAEMNGDSSDFSRRMSRNVQHLLQLESFIGEVVDPALGSYYVDTLTKQLAEKVWGEMANQ